jgi:Starch synthase catalytic domain
MAPVAKVGGLGDVVQGLAKASLERGHKVQARSQSPPARGAPRCHRGHLQPPQSSASRCRAPQSAAGAHDAGTESVVPRWQELAVQLRHSSRSGYGAPRAAQEPQRHVPCPPCGPCR